MIDTGYLLTHLIYPYFLANDYSFDHSDTGSDHEIFLCWFFFDKGQWRTIGPKSFLFAPALFSLWPDGAGNYDYIITNSINSLLIGSRCIFNGTRTNHC